MSQYAELSDMARDQGFDGLMDCRDGLGPPSFAALCADLIKVIEVEEF